MKLLFLGAGATGGYFGGYLAKAGVDVTFLVRPKRREQLARDGLKIESADGRLDIPVKAITRDEIVAPYDAVILSAKAYDLDSAIDAIRPAVGDKTLILPVLNGMKHLDTLDAAFGAARVLGGLTHISVTLTEDGIIRQFGQLSTLTMGARFAGQKAAATALYETLARGIEVRHADDIIFAMWEKWYFLAAFAASTCLMRAGVGDIVRAAHGAEFTLNVLNECTAIAGANGYPPQPETMEFSRTFLTDPASTLSASMLRDIQRGEQIEADQIVGDMIRRGRAHGVATPLLDLAYLHLQAYENRRAAVKPG
ncbi:2-dehydropantoate 2-reductase [Hyphomicrobium sp. 802]|uniref:2-dehydropantoate 2-reductase n=1 Tax=Hyphomicrobium sp. 802 TaxID=1112272 RepID=UPI00045E693C|nr:2-dehydropantoate 2-reductase [Hyphomicrobium sp. 802]